MTTKNTEDKVPVAITIAGSDSSGGAGIQADIKTFASLGVFGVTAVTAVTAQNTVGVFCIERLKPEIVLEQIKAVAEDIGIDAGKTGMLYSDEVIKTISEAVSEYRFPLVVDPVMVAKSRVPLLKPQALRTLKEYLLPKATVVTPNKFEAERLSGVKIRRLDDAENAAKRISELGPRAVVVKGGHIHEKEAIDIVYYEGQFRRFQTPRLSSKTTHGTGCVFSAAITACLARKMPLITAIEKAKEIVWLGIKYGLNIGKGHGPVNSIALFYRESSRYQVLINVDKAKNLLESSPEVSALVPEVGMNVAMAVPYAGNITEVAAIDGRLVKTFKGVKAAGNVKFGCSSHLAKYILEVSKYDKRKTAAINLKFSEHILKILEDRGMVISFFDRKREPQKIKIVEGKTIPWGVEKAIKRIGKVPDVIFHRGDVGKEPMIVVFGEQAYNLADLTVQLAKEIKNEYE
ncbi:MAG: bifunctional hydroxymethylpyrimidine kinase/phosphomethylpyrimidine kinase [Candidatus Bathyarchaeia archaeon]|nr:bifunctional hydroxymethylpyrimidine kinase/phosphomethylpyrimidine kinase [Candidatus Bathyarchaeota archaeon]